MMVTLTCGQSVCTIFPEIGGSIGSWLIDEQPMLRSASDIAVAARNPLGMASFPLVPFSNRIGNAKFEWQGHQHRIRKNFPPERHAIHGIGWTTQWAITAQTEATLTLECQYEVDDEWPWPFAAKQHFALAEDALQLTLSVENLAPHDVPLGFGHHPYFDSDGASLQFNADHVWTNANNHLPRVPASPVGQFDFSEAATVNGRKLDHCYDGVGTSARIRWDDRRRGVDICHGMPAATVYIPPHSDHFCFEPVSHMNNAINLQNVAAPMHVVASGEAYTTMIRFQSFLDKADN